MSHALVKVVPVDMGHESICRCGHTEWALDTRGAVDAFCVHLDTVAVTP